MVKYDLYHVCVPVAAIQSITIITVLDYTQGTVISKQAASRELGMGPAVIPQNVPPGTAGMDMNSTVFPRKQ